MGHALNEYAVAVREYEAGNKDEAARRLSLALGSETTLPPVASSIDSLIYVPEPLLPAVLKQMLSEEKKRGRA